MQQLLVAFLFLLFSYSFSSAQDATTLSTTGDLLEDSAQNWSGTYGTGWWGGVSGGPNPNRLPTDTGFIWSYGDNVLSTTIAINTALQQAGIQVNGYTYVWRVKNGNANIYTQQPGIDDFIITVDVLDSNGNTYQSYEYDYSYSHNWTNHIGAEIFPDQFLPPSYFSNIVVSAQGEDVGYWAGWYGPEFNVRDSELRLVFGTNPCHNNQLYDPQCPDYANALFDQQCSINPLFDTSCVGYAAAYLSQQCSANSLYDTSCPGYAQAYYNQQCSQDPLYDVGCEGYADAYLNQQCSQDTLYDSSCDGYDVAYFNQQCSLDATYNLECPGFYLAMCDQDPLYSPGCVGYDTAYLNYQCSLDSQYDQTCIGYVDLSNDGDFTEIFDPVIEDILEEEYNENIYVAELTVPDFVIEFFEEALEVDIMFAERDNFEEALEQDLEDELSDLDNEEFREITFERDDDADKTDDGQSKTENATENEVKSLEETPEGKGKSEQVEKPKADIQESSSNVRTDPVSSRREKLKMLIAAKANQATKELEEAVTLEQQMNIQRRILALISFVPDFKDEYTEKEVTQVNFYPPKPVVDHAYARWFLNDPTYEAMEDLQYPSLR